MTSVRGHSCKTNPKNTAKKKEIVCFRCKKVGYYASKCEEELPPKTPKIGSNMLITDKESSVNQDNDEDDKSKQYDKDQGIDKDKPGQILQRSWQ